MKEVIIYDTTLRDGAQAQGISFTVEDKLKIAKAVDNLGISYIEAGNPGSNPKDIEFFQRVKDIGLKHAKISAFGSTRRVNVPVEEDSNVISLLAAGTPVVAHIRQKLGFPCGCHTQNDPGRKPENDI